MSTALPAIPADAAYPIDANDYRVSATLLKNYNNPLRNHILSTIVDVATRTMLSDKYPTDGRALLQHLRTRAEHPLKTSQVNSIILQIDSLVNAGIKYDDAKSFRDFTVHYHRILRRIPPANASKDTPAMQAMRYIKAVIKNREDMGRAIMNHFASHNTDHNDPDAVHGSLCVFLDDHATVRRLCSANMQPVEPSLPPALPDINSLMRSMDNMQTEIKALYSAQSLFNGARHQTNRDPRKGPPKDQRYSKSNFQRRPFDRPWQRGRDRPCRTPGCEGPHWDIDCPDRDKRNQKEATALVNATRVFSKWDDVTPQVSDRAVSLSSIASHFYSSLAPTKASAHENIYDICPPCQREHIDDLVPTCDTNVNNDALDMFTETSSDATSPPDVKTAIQSDDSHVNDDTLDMFIETFLTPPPSQSDPCTPKSPILVTDNNTTHVMATAESTDDHVDPPANSTTDPIPWHQAIAQELPRQVRTQRSLDNSL